MFPIVEPRNATSRGPAAVPDGRVPVGGDRPRFASKSDTTACTSRPGYSTASASPAASSADSLTSTITYDRSVPADCRALSSSLVFSDDPDPSSTKVAAFDSAAISPDTERRIDLSARVG